MGLKIAIVGTAPSTCRKAPYSDESWKIWGCSPGLFPVAPRTDAWFETHRWEPPVLGKPELQKPWFSPEYVAWLRAYKGTVWMFDDAALKDVPNAKLIPHHDLMKKYGMYFFTSSIAWMMALAIEAIEKDREDRRKKAEAFAAETGGGAAVMDGAAEEPDMLGLFGIDMSANEEYGYQRAGCQAFVQIAHSRQIKVVVPMESDLLCPPTLYGLSETTHRHIKFLERERELQTRIFLADQRAQQAHAEAMFLRGALDDNTYHRGTWVHEGDILGADLNGITKGLHIYDDPAAVAAFAKTEEPADAGSIGNAAAAAAQQLVAMSTAADQASADAFSSSAAKLGQAAKVRRAPAKKRRR